MSLVWPCENETCVASELTRNDILKCFSLIREQFVALLKHSEAEAHSRAWQNIEFSCIL